MSEEPNTAAIRAEWGEGWPGVEVLIPLCDAVDQLRARADAYMAQVIERDERIDAGLNVCDDMDANGNSRELGDPTATTWHKASQLVRRALTEGAGQ